MTRFAFVVFPKIWRALAFFFRAQKIWHWPRQSSVLIYDANGQDILLEYLGAWAYEVLHVRGEQINIPVLVASLLRKGKKSHAYVDCYIDKVRPQLVVTFTDNHVDFYTLKGRHQNLKTISIQNGWRSYYSDIFEAVDKMDEDCRKTLAADYILSFGSVIGKAYAQRIACIVVPMGSIKSNRVKKATKRLRDTIAFVSQWHPENIQLGTHLVSQENFFARTDRPVIQFLTRYARECNKQVVIVPRTPQQTSLRAQEELYFRRLLEDKPKFLQFEGSDSSYQAIDAAEIVVAIDTTLGYESIARGNKTAIFSIRGALLDIDGLRYGWPGEFADEGLYWTNHNNPSCFERILDYLYAVDDSQWRRDVNSTQFSSLMIDDPGNSILRSILGKELERNSSTRNM